ncbi:copper amine oxidase N-terminal domain-containing protein [Desulfotomaculum nigrificans]|uniref:copper amine oxidase N-terminal domain-containing protein n=1 Tax=Desulfotomaculum nigrificans TaxID=1565 RepID=UPI0001FAE7D3|nr:copper amine oxidase N-terminal domain-containing protein [Desulfotomaculum nigrificans]
MIKKLISSVLVAVCLLSVLPSSAFAETFEISGTYVTWHKNGSNIANQVVMYPLRQSAHNLGYKVHWSEGKAIVNTGGKSYEINVGSNKVYDSAGNYVGELGLAPSLENGRIYVDVSFFTKILGFKLE